MNLDAIEQLVRQHQRIVKALTSFQLDTYAGRIENVFSQLNRVRVPTAIPEILQNTTELSRRIEATTKIVQQVVSVNRDAIEQAAASAVKIYSAVDQWLQHNRQVFDGFYRLIDWLAEKQELVDAFQDCNLWVCPSMSKDLLKRVVELRKENKTNVVLLVVNNYYRRNDHKNLRAAVDNWEANPYFEERMPIFRQALEAHVQGKYALTIPTLLAQAEGVASEYVYQNGLQVKLGKTTDVITKAVRDSLTITKYATVDTLLAYVMNSGYVYTDFGVEIKKKRRATTRHTVLHGIQPNYHSQTNSLRAFLLLDALSILENL
jgi:hypothetical protein